MTLSELRILVEELNVKVTDASNKVVELKAFISEVNNAVQASNPFSEAIDVDAFVALQNPLYQAKLTTAKDAVQIL